MAPEVDFAIGMIDATQNKKIANRYDVRGFPTLMFARDGDVQKYKGSRSEDALRSFFERLQGPPVTTLSSIDDPDFVDGSQVAFVLKGGDDAVLEAYTSYAKTDQHAHLYGYVADGGAPELCRVENAEEPSCLQVDVANLSDFVSSYVDANDYATLSELSGENFSKLANLPGKNLVVTVVRQSEINKVTTALELMRSVSRANRNSPFVFTYLDYDRFSDWVKSFKELQCVTTDNLLISFTLSETLFFSACLLAVLA